MKPPDEKQAISEIAAILADLLGGPPKAIKVDATDPRQKVDFYISTPDHLFLGEYKSNAQASIVAVGIEQLQQYAQAAAVAGLPLLVVPYMGEVGRQLCDQAGVSWLDLSGNAKIVAPGLHVRVEGRPNKYLDRGRPPNAFAPKSSRVARQLLLHPHQFQAQVALVRATELEAGYVSKIVRRLGQEQYLETNEAGAVRPRDPDLLLDAWHDSYDFSRHRIIKGHVAARSGDELIQRVAQAVGQENVDWAVTGLGAAWLYTRFAAFRLATVYLSPMPPRSLLKALDFSDEPKGANLWLVLPDDEGVFHGSQEQDAVRCVSPIQTYLDLKGQPERSKDAAAELRRKLLNWGRHGS
ncbi:MAG TPA: hypothetical protein VMS17_13150 [Gemmataceae bacterium]|nr:hypothetical protein [Gemmataceae bacterium]